MPDDPRLAPEAKEAIRSYVFRLLTPPAILLSILSFIAGAVVKTTAYNDAYQQAYAAANTQILGYVANAGQAKAQADQASVLIERVARDSQKITDTVNSLPAYANWKNNLDELQRVLLQNTDFQTRIRQVAEVVVAAGAVDRTGTILRRAGKSLSVVRQQAGRYRVVFADQLPAAPIAVAISDGGQAGAFAEITAIDSNGFTVEGRTYSTHGLADIGFQFIAVRSEK